MVTEGLAIMAIVLAAALATYLDVTMRRRRRFRYTELAGRFLFPYLLPALLIAAFAAYSFSALVIIPYYPGSPSLCGLHDPACRARINPEANQFYSMIGIAIACALALGYLALLAWRRISSRPVPVY
jgi:hypothetical protein